MVEKHDEASSDSGVKVSGLLSFTHSLLIFLLPHLPSKWLYHLSLFPLLHPIMILDFAFIDAPVGITRSVLTTSDHFSSRALTSPALHITPSPLHNNHTFSLSHTSLTNLPSQSEIHYLQNDLRPSNPATESPRRKGQKVRTTERGCDKGNPVD